MKALAPKLGLAVAALASVFAMSAEAQRGPGGPGRGPGGGPGRDREEVVLLGTTRLSPLADADRIRINSCAGDDVQRVAAIRIRAAKHTSNIEQIRLTYANLNTDYVDVRTTVRPGDSTGWIDVAGRARCVREIQVIGSSGSLGLKKSTIEIYGIKRERDDRDRDDRRDDGPRGPRDDRDPRDDRGPRGPRDPRDDRGPRGPGRR